MKLQKKVSHAISRNPTTRSTVAATVRVAPKRFMLIAYPPPVQAQTWQFVRARPQGFRGCSSIEGTATEFGASALSSRRQSPKGRKCGTRSRSPVSTPTKPSWLRSIKLLFVSDPGESSTVANDLSMTGFCVKIVLITIQDFIGDEKILVENWKVPGFGRLWRWFEFRLGYGKYGTEKWWKVED